MMLLRAAFLVVCVGVMSSHGRQLASDGYISHKFETTPDHPLLHFTLNNRDGKVYISAVNRIYQLDKDIERSSMIEVITGPVNDSQSCLPYLNGCVKNDMEMTNNYNKLLVLDEGKDRLLVCGSVYQGLCDARNLTNIRQVLTEAYCKKDAQCRSPTLPLLSCLDENCTTIAVIAEGPTVNNNVLYVATTAVNTAFRSEPYSVSKRSLHIDPTKENKLFLWAIDGIGEKSRTKLPEEPYTKYFRYGFATDGLDGFVYFVYEKIHELTNTTTIARVCKKDVLFNSYIEMNLTCEGVSQDENGVLVDAYYQKNVGNSDFRLSNTNEGALYIVYKKGASSSLCIYTIEDLNQKFDQTIVSCYQEKGKDGNETVAKSRKDDYECDGASWMPGPDTSLDDTVVRKDAAPALNYYKDYSIPRGTFRCGAQYLPSFLERIPEVPSTWSYALFRFKASGITVDLVDGINVAHIGTEEGELVQLDVNHKNIFNIIDIGNPVLKDLTLDRQAAIPHLYVMTRSEVFHIKVSICKRHKTCADCLGARDPYCGWCILESRCMPATSQCHSNGWLKPLTEHCIEATVLEPLERTLQQDVEVNVKLLPSLSPGDRYECIFNGETVMQVGATVESIDKDLGLVRCPAPGSKLLPATIDGKDHVNVTLGILFNGKVNIVTTMATFYECQAHGRNISINQPCQGCIENRWSNTCSWCIESHTCVPSASEVCVSSSESCPMVISDTNSSQLLPVGVPSDILLSVKNLPASANADMSCDVQIEDEKSYNVKAFVVGEARDQVRCETKTYKYSSQQTEAPANVTLCWKQRYVVDVSSFGQVTFYNTSIKFTDCSLCVTASPKYKSGWCQSTSKCVVEQLCPSKDWVTSPDRCPPPEITSLSPKSGPIPGRTKLTITGLNLGINVSQVSEVTVAGIPCSIELDDYEVSNKIVCITGEAPKETRGKVSVTVRGSKVTSKEEFSYRNPKILHLDVKEGPVSGGTLLTISGDNLDTGFERKAFLLSERYGKTPCILDTSAQPRDVIKCRTEALEKPVLRLELLVEIDGFRASKLDAFNYVKDPTISSYSTASGDKLASFLAGGRNITFKGERLNITQRAILTAIFRSDVIDEDPTNARRRRRSTLKKIAQYMISGKRFKRSSEYKSCSSDCKIVNDIYMDCPSPAITLECGGNFLKNVSEATSVKASLRMMLDNLNFKIPNATLTYYPNPIVRDLSPDSKNVRNGTTLTIVVQNLHVDAIEQNEVVVKVGESPGDLPCEVTNLNFGRRNQDGSISCKMPRKPNDDANNFPVTVIMGSMTWSIGEVTYDHQETPQGLVVGLIVAATVTVFVVVIVGVYMLRKRKHYKANKNDFKNTIEVLEMSVQNDFRKAFAELSIDMTDLTSDIGDVGLLILNYRQYATNMFFPSIRYHPCMKEPDPTQNPIHQIQQGFAQFDLLITNKHFLISFIHTLEQQKSFSQRDKGNVASLITVVLHKKLDYFTEVMKSLISELVATSVERNPKLVFRRTESVAERMFSNWVSICLFPYIRDKAGKPLFLLQKAIKHQVSKGALDAETGKARYTLSDDSLLKEDVPCEPLTLFVSQSETRSDEPVIVKVLSCDSISQVKEKVMDTVYKRIAFSQRPKADQLDLEWRHGRRGRLVLPDRDFVTEQGSRWRRLMTIKDYKVDNNATMALIPRQQKVEDMVSQYTNQSADASAISPMLPEENVKVYHLVKYADDIEQKRESSILRDKHKHILDLYLLRLISMKGILQNYVDEVFQAILDTNSVPPAVKHFFDFLDELAKKNGIEDEEILHIWKTNSILGRFWVTILKNPEAVFDIDKPDSVESSMAVISQTFIDACSVQEHKPTKDSPINKQLYAKEIPNYKRMVQKYYQDVKEKQTFSDQDMSAHMADISRSHNLDFDVHAAHNELWGYVNKYYEELQETLSNDPNATQMVIQRLQQAYTLIDSSINNP